MSVRIAYAGPPEKWSRLGWSDFISYAATKNVEVFALDFTRPLSDQGPISLLVHKLTFFMKGTDFSVHPWLHALDAFAREHPDIPIVDDLTATAITLNRGDLTRALEAIQWPSDLRVLLPKTAVLSDASPDAIAQTVSALRFPLIAKAAPATGTAAAHQMRLVTLPEHLAGVPTPSFLQEFVNHNGIVYKIYALGDHLEAGARPSMRNIGEGEVINVDFHSQHSEIDNGLWVRKEAIGKVELPMGDFARMSAVLRQALKLNLIGFDILIDQDGQYWLVDLNFFPGYKNIENVWERFLQFFLGLINKQTE